MKNALILSGGGARAAYQVGVLKALAEILPADAHNPFPIICGTSAGAINALALASHPENFRQAVVDLERVWRSLTPEQIYLSSLPALGGSLLRLGASLFNEGAGRSRPLALLNNSPLREWIDKTIQFENIEKAITNGDLEAVCVTAMGYSSGESVSFFQGHPRLTKWRRVRRVGFPCRLNADHLLASSAIPTVFPSVFISREYFGDGALRQLAPISPALHMGADRIFVIGVSGNRNPVHWRRKPLPKHSPSMAQIMGHMLNSAFVDSLEGDIEHLDRINELLKLIPDEVREEALLRPVDNLIISPSEPLDRIAGQKIRYIPPMLRFLLRTVGATAKGGGATAASYLLFTPSFCGTLIDLGYKDAIWEREGIERFFSSKPTEVATGNRFWSLSNFKNPFERQP
ncbi:MAG: patatin-like phospholipase family protein [Motiliproteus sp.]